MENREPITVVLLKDLLATLNAEAKRTNTSRSRLVENILLHAFQMGGK
jgi:metal-responsive CopG/Arc/MetJ family transcriptional regulator